MLSRSLDLKETLSAVLRALHDGVGLERGMVSLIEPETGDLLVTVAHGLDETYIDEIRYRPGEGVVGMILEEGEPIVVERIADEPRFLGRLGIYDPQGAFVGVPIRIGRKVTGVLAAQPAPGAEILLEEYTHFLEMVANLIGQSVRLPRRRTERRSLTEERDILRRTVRGQYGFDNIIGHTQAMRRVFEQARLVAKWNTTVLIRGETGTGKELIANAIHYNSPRARSPFVKLNCAALPENLLESELFGHEKGAFTGAVSAAQGPLRAGRRRHAVPRRDRRSLRRLPGQAAARAAGRRIRARRRHPHHQGRRARDRRHQPRPGSRGRGRTLPRGPVLPPQRHADLPARRCASASRTSPTSPASWWTRSAASRGANSGSPKRPCAC